jgi:hypothetical protein
MFHRNVLIKFQYISTLKMEKTLLRNVGIHLLKYFDPEEEGTCSSENVVSISKALQSWRCGQNITSNISMHLQDISILKKEAIRSSKTLLSSVSNCKTLQQ